jgi:hypothetical protein
MLISVERLRYIHLFMSLIFLKNKHKHFDVELFPNLILVKFFLNKTNWILDSSSFILKEKGAHNLA